MKLTAFLIFIIFVFNFAICQETVDRQVAKSKTSLNNKSGEERSTSKSDIIGTWRACGDANWDENADTLSFQRATPNCSGDECGEHNWSFRETGSVEFVYTDGCNSGFHSVSKNPKRWLFIQKDNRIKLITNDGYVEYFDVLSTGEKLVLVHRRDLELE